MGTLSRLSYIKMVMENATQSNKHFIHPTNEKLLYVRVID